MDRKNRRPQLSAGEIAAYQMGMELASEAETRRTRRVRREIRVREDEVVLIEEEIWIEESNWGR